MKKFIVLYHAAPADMKRWKNSTPAQKKAGMAQWYAWKKQMGGKLLDFGAPLGKGAKVSRSSSGPGTKSLCGYSFIKAASLADAKKAVKKHPHNAASATCRIEVVEIVRM